MKFQTQEANELFKIAIMVEKEMLKAKSMLLKGKLNDTDFINLKKLLVEMNQINSNLLNNKFLEFLDGKGLLK